MVKFGWLFVFLLLLVLQVAAQTTKNIKVTARKSSLNRVLLDLKEAYGIQFAFDNDLLSQYEITLNRTFQSESEAITYLVRNLPLEVERSGEVFLIIPVSEKTQEQNTNTQISGQVLEAQTYEPLPYSYIIINQRSVQSNQQGHFNFIASADSSFNLRISHLGYFIYDTVITQSLNRKFLLTPQIERIQEVRIERSLIEKSTLIGDRAGRMKINHQIAPFLPGHGDNSVFNLLRLMPGILASGEQSNDLLIWGGYESHSKIQFDGFTVFGLKNFNDNISVVNPFMVKNIEVMKGGYEARYGDRVGGIVDITGKNGTLQKPSFTFNINTTTLNSLVEIPLSKKTSLLAAYRQTYYQLYDPTNLNLFRKNNDNGNQSLSNGIDFEVKPDFNFRDANLKYTIQGDNGSQFFVSLYGGGDRFQYDMEGDYLRNTITRTEEEKNRQFGSSMQFSQPWINGNSTYFMVSYSAFNRHSEEQNINYNSWNHRKKITKSITSENKVDELAFKTEHTFSFVNAHKLILGAGIINNKVVLTRKSFNTNVINLNNSSPRLFAYVQDELPFGDAIQIKTGLRVIYTSELEKYYFEPRISTSFRITEGFKINASWGLYNQFMSKTTVVDSSYNFSYFWTNSDNENIPVLNAEHLVGGISYSKNGFTISGEGYYKTTDGINRFFNGNKLLEQGFYEGKAKSYGLDLYIKKEYKKHMAWISYTLSKTEEHFPFYVKDYYKLAPHHQTHELKLAAIINLKSFYFSTNYVYGSGFERYNFETEDGTKLNQDYKRLDAALVYRFKPGRVKAEVGVSVLNVLDTDNIKYSNLRRATVDDISLVGIYAEAVPFTPAIFFKIML